MNLLDAFLAGGVFMYFIAAFGLLTLAFIVERFIALYVTHKTAPADFRKNILSFISQGDFKAAQDYVEMSAGNTGLGKITNVALKMRTVGAGDEALQARMDEQLSKEISSVDRRTGFLAMFGNVSTLFGLLGTVTGLISSFAGVAAASPVERANLLSQGISEALNSTAFGLVAAIPALVAFAIYQNKTEQIISSLTESASELYHDFLFYTESHKEDAQAATAMATDKKGEQTVTRN
ncbi:MAG: gliding motility protein [Halobacteriovoraceae bacterium]|nr:gliding motility protein [Halobacteriovoraceae bacterium]MBC97759.1 gliding motility protein [Halobacteriovoraceae bacterium]|tara:strand:+ start:3813 stop:4520 length:708 start_codon:yes stop_codon:yes gene_type:complete